VISSEILSKIKNIELRSRKIVNEVFSGKYHSAFKGQGIEFTEVREYAPGDDIRRIDWNVTARRGAPFIKKFQEEREQTVIFAVDLSASGLFGSAEILKQDLAAELTAVLAFAALKNNDRTGLMAFTDTPEKYLKPKKSRKHILSLIDTILDFTPANRGTSINTALENLNNLWRRKALVFLISDFKDKNFEDLLKSTARRHDLVCVHISDPRETELTKGYLPLKDPETGKAAYIDLSSKQVRKEYAKALKEHEDYLTGVFTSAKCDVIKISTGKPYIAELINFFKRRMTRQNKHY
jgi:uncharacterized protein (DUF58 family)